MQTPFRNKLFESEINSYFPDITKYMCVHVCSNNEQTYTLTKAKMNL